MAVEILKQAEVRRIKFSPTFVCSEENWLADVASRLKTAEDWSLKEQTFGRIVKCFGKPDVDLMATQRSRKCLAFISFSKRDKEAVQVDALAQDVSWKGWEKPYCFPPPALVG